MSTEACHRLSLSCGPWGGSGAPDPSIAALRRPGCRLGLPHGDRSVCAQDGHGAFAGGRHTEVLGK